VVILALIINFPRPFEISPLVRCCEILNQIFEFKIDLSADSLDKILEKMAVIGELDITRGKVRSLRTNYVFFLFVKCPEF